MGMPVQQTPIIIEMARENWSWVKYALGILAAVLTAVITELFKRRFSRKEKKR